MKGHQSTPPTSPASVVKDAVDIEMDIESYEDRRKNGFKDLQLEAFRQMCLQQKQKLNSTDDPEAKWKDKTKTMKMDHMKAMKGHCKAPEGLTPENLREASTNLKHARY